MEREEIKIPHIKLKWSNWIPWDNLKKDARKGGISIPNRKSGVYEVKYVDKKSGRKKEKSYS